MSEQLKNLFDSFYTRFVLRDLLAKISPGLFVILSMLSVIPNDLIHKPFIYKFPWLISMSILLFSWILGFAIQGIGELRLGKWLSLNQYFPQKIFEDEKKWNIFRLKFDEVATDNDKQGSERFVIIKETCGNFRVAMIVVGLIFLSKYLMSESGSLNYQDIDITYIIVYIVFYFGLRHMHFKHVERQHTFMDCVIEKKDEESFFKSLSNLSPDAVQTIQKLYAFTQENAAGIRWGTGRLSSSFSYTVDSVKKKFNIFAVLNQGDTGRILLNFGAMKGIIPDNELHAFKESLNQLPEVELPAYMVDEGKYPSIFVKSVIQPENFERFTNEVLRLQGLAKGGKVNKL